MLNHSQYFRISVVNTCNLSCYFCHNEGANVTGGKLSIDDLEMVCRIAKQQGFRKFKLTGGEPTIRPDIVELVSRLAAIGLDDFSMITNGTLLTRLAAPLKEAGLQRINVSLHTLNQEKYEKLNVKQKVNLNRIVQGIDKALEVGFKNIKINFVYMGSKSDDDLEDILSFIMHRDLTLVVLPIMEKGSGHSITLQNLYEKFIRKGIVSEKLIIDSEGIRKRLITLESGAKILLRIDELANRNPYTFCSTCSVKNNRREGIFPLRLSAEGELIPCLANYGNRINIRKLLQERNQEEINKVFQTIQEWGAVNEKVF